MELTTRIKAEAIAAGFKMMTGFAPAVTERPDGTAYLVFAQADVPKIRSKIEEIALKAGKGGGDVSMSLSPIMTPLAFKYMLPVIGLIFGAGVIAGIILKAR